jgi:hypothetical protein
MVGRSNVGAPKQRIFCIKNFSPLTFQQKREIQFYKKNKKQWRHDIQPNDTWHNDRQPKNLQFNCIHHIDTQNIETQNKGTKLKTLSIKQSA